MNTITESIIAKPFQAQFLLSKKRYPALVAGVGTGKTFFMLLKDWRFCITYPGALSLIVRKEYTDLRDSTIKDFERYFNVEVDSDKEYKFPNGSVIMFRHGNELNVLKNINLSRFSIEQAEEFESEEAFTMLRDRLRRDGAPYRQGVIIANTNGDNWVKRYWKDGQLAESELFEASTFDNADNLPADFIDDLKRMEKETPAHYKQYVLNDWNITDDQFVLIPPDLINKLQGIFLNPIVDKGIISCDPSLGGDECVIYAFTNSQIIDKKILHEKDTMKITGELMLMSALRDINDIAVDVIGIGQGIADRLSEMGKNVIRINSASSSVNQKKFYNLRAEIWWRVMEKMLNKEIEYPDDAELRKQLSSVRYKVVNSNGEIKIEHKDEIKKRLGYSPDRADAYVYAIWGLDRVQPKRPKDRYKTKEPGYVFNPATV